MTSTSSVASSQPGHLDSVSESDTDAALSDYEPNFNYKSWFATLKFFYGIQPDEISALREYASDLATPQQAAHAIASNHKRYTDSPQEMWRLQRLVFYALDEWPESHIADLIAMLSEVQSTMTTHAFRNGLAYGRSRDYTPYSC